MKLAKHLPVALILALPACETGNQPVTTGAFDPLRSPGLANRQGPAVTSTFKAGEFVTAMMDNTGFYKSMPEGNATADKLLARGASMKVVSEKNGYVKVELDSGEVGFVPSVLVQTPTGASATPFAANPGEIQVYPPVNSFGTPLPPVEEPPGGAIPTIIDPDAPVPTPEIPTEEFPAEPMPSPTPLPPNGEEGDAAAAEAPPAPETKPLPPNE
jgi:hypothetical protein